MTTCDTFVLFIANLARTPWASAFRFSSTKTGVLEAMGRQCQAGLSLEASGVLVQQLHTVSVHEVLAGPVYRI